VCFQSFFLFICCCSLQAGNCCGVRSRVTVVPFPATLANLQVFDQSEDNLARSSHSQESSPIESAPPQSELIPHYWELWSVQSKCRGNQNEEWNDLVNVEFKHTVLLKRKVKPNKRNNKETFPLQKVSSYKYINNYYNDILLSSNYKLLTIIYSSHWNFCYIPFTPQCNNMTCIFIFLWNIHDCAMLMHCLFYIFDPMCIYPTNLPATDSKGLLSIHLSKEKETEKFASLHLTSSLCILAFYSQKAQNTWSWGLNNDNLRLPVTEAYRWTIHVLIKPAMHHAM